MLFVFIDDIDLSNTRCMDVAKTLLSYLSKQRIITIVAGDYNNFAEAMTLDFLRQEKVLDSNSIDKNFGSDSNISILKARKRLSFEYLRKIMPPIYRYNIKTWSLKDCCKFYSVEASVTLGELLDEYIKGTDCIFDFSDKNQNKDNVLEENEFLEYCIFDNTSRGLNNVYSVLVDLNNNNDKNHKKLIETIVRSKYLFMEHKQKILSDIIIFGNEKFSVDFSQAKKFLELSSVLNDDEKTSFFFMFEFCRQLFGQSEKNDLEYQNLKLAVLKKIISKKLNVNKEIEIGKTKNSYEYKCENIIDAFICESCFIAAIHFIEHISSDVLKAVYLKDTEINDYKKSICFLYALSVASREIGSEVIENQIADIRYIDMIINNLSDNTMENYGNLIFEINLNSIYGLNYIGSNSVLTNLQSYVYEFSQGYADKKETEYAINFASALFSGNSKITYTKNSAEILQSVIPYIVKKSIIKTILINLSSIFLEYRINKLTETYSENELDDERKKVIYSVEKNNMWRNRFVTEKIGNYIREYVRDFLNKFQNSILFFDISELKSNGGALKEFNECNEGVSNENYIKSCKKNIQKIINLYDNSILDGDCISLGQLCMIYYELNFFVQNHRSAIYGYSESRMLLNKIQELPIIFLDKDKYKEIKNNMYQKIQEKEISMINICEQNAWYGKKRWDSIDKYVEHCNEEYFAGQKDGKDISYSMIFSEDDYIKKEYRRFIEYLAYKKEFEHAVIEKQSNQKQIIEREEELPKWTKEEKFIFHAYIRYMEDTEPEFAKYYIWSENAAEIIPKIDEIKVQNDTDASKEFYDIISQEIDISEEEFNDLF